MTLTLYGVARSRASRNIWLCLEADLPFEQVPVIQARRVKDALAADAPLNTRSPAFLAVNPNSLVPAMRDGELVLFESLAINLYLARKIGAPLGPADLVEEGRILMWSLWSATEAEPWAMQILMHRAYLPEAERDPTAAIRAAGAPPSSPSSTSTCRARQLVADRFTVADINAAEVLRFRRPRHRPLRPGPQRQRWFKTASPPRLQEMMRRREAEPA